MRLQPPRIETTRRGPALRPLVARRTHVVCIFPNDRALIRLAATELGAALRRANRRSQAREHLRQAVELAAICGAVPPVRRAESELLATGARPRRVYRKLGISSRSQLPRALAERVPAS